ncbi:hypothetical protein [Kitasatospora sp. NPDC059827]|uniref:hypothetical protein n=1 Tax=Kitasatospora sp. NPDC059827 TaxID=3346964 RepID=UPI00364E0B55
MTGSVINGEARAGVEDDPAIDQGHPAVQTVQLRGLDAGEVVGLSLTAHSGVHRVAVTPLPGPAARAIEQRRSLA